MRGQRRLYQGIWLPLEIAIFDKNTTTEKKLFRPHNLKMLPHPLTHAQIKTKIHII